MEQKKENTHGSTGFRIAVNKFKRGYLELPKDFLLITTFDLEKEPLFFRDMEGNNFIFEITSVRLRLK